MKDSCYNKSLVFGIIVLFIGAGVVPSISGYTEKISVLLIEELPANSPSYDDYINGYWKFDENTGSTAHDSSGHDYDGGIYGASWTSGKIGYALDFDGVNDYITLDDYAKDFLGFNKTDDLIFSFYFKSSSTDKGIIYGMSTSNDYNPGFHIALNSDGTLKVKVYRFNCGIILTSEGSYNDGAWHYVELWYNGISANPTLKL